MLHKFIFLVLLSLTFASSGDRLPEFKTCVDQCVHAQCPEQLPLHLRLLAWTCESNCDYNCQQDITDYQEKYRLPVHQYHGKWPFIRVWGIQEPASVIFSLANLIPNYFGFKKLYRAPRFSQNSMLKYYLAFAIVGMNTWTWSSVFHTRDFVLTERLDYFSAIGSILYGLFLAVVRIFRLDRPQNHRQLYAMAAICLGFYSCHVYYLSFVRFNYTYNMAAGVVLGLIQTSLWIYMAISTYSVTKRSADLVPAALVVMVIASSGFELFDFSPFGRAIDAHSLWHLATVLPTCLWYKWIVHDLSHGTTTARPKS